MIIKNIDHHKSNWTALMVYITNNYLLLFYITTMLKLQSAEKPPKSAAKAAVPEL